MTVSRLWLVISWIICGSLCVGAIHWLDQAGKSPVSAAIFVGGLATCGWLFTNYRSRKNQIEKNTFDLILTYTKDKFYVDHKAIIWRAFPPYKDIGDEQVKILVDSYYDQTSYASQDNPAFSLVQIINFYEYLAIGIRRGLLSERLCKAYFSTTFKNLDKKKAGKFVQAIIDRDNSTRADSSSSSIFSNYLWLLRRWTAAPAYGRNT